MHTSTASFLADLVVIVHLAFIAFVVLGGLLVLRWPKAAWAHLPAALWGAAVELAGWSCPLTPLEYKLRAAAGQAAHDGDFVARLLMPLIYPEGLTREIQLALGGVVVVLNMLIYGWAWRRRAAGTEAARQGR